MSVEVESQEQQKEVKFNEKDSSSLSSTQAEAPGDKVTWTQPATSDGKIETGDGTSLKLATGLSSNGGSVPSFGKDDDQSYMESLGTGNSIWGQKAGLKPDAVWSAGQSGIDWGKKDEQSCNSLSSMLQGIAGEGISNMSKDGGKTYPWSSSTTMQDNQGTSDALGLSVDFWKSSMFSGYGGSGGWGDSRTSNWGLSDIKNEFNREGLPDKKAVSEQDRSKTLWGGPEERKVDPIGPVQKRSASLTELNVTFESTSLGTEGIKFPSTNKITLNDERSQPDGAEVSQQNREELIAKMINSNEGWGKKPISQDTPWHMDSITGPSPVDPLPSVAETAVAAKNDVFWNVPKETNTSSWNNNPPMPSTYEWTPDSDIGVWSGPPPPDSINPNMWTGPPKEVSPVWLGQSGIVDKTMMPHGVLSWGDRGVQGPGLDKLQKESFDRARGAPDAPWMQQSQRSTSDNSWISPEVNTWSMPLPADQHDSWGAKQPLNNFPLSGLGGKPDPLPSIGTWGDGTVTETGQWNQQQPLSNMQNPLQQLMDLGFKKEDAVLLQNNMGMDKILELMKLNKDSETPKGRIIRGKSMVEMQSGDVGQFGQFQGGRNSGYQMGRTSAFQPAVPSGLPPHMKGSAQQASVGGWGGMGMQMYGRTPAMPVASSNSVPQMNAQVMQNVLHLQSLLQPLLHQRSQVQHNRNLTPAQKSMQIDKLNVYIADLKQRLEQVQLPFGPPPGPVAPHDMQFGMDETKVMQLLGQLKLDRDFGMVPHPPLGPVNDFSMADGKTSVGGFGNLSMDQMAALINSNRLLNPETLGGLPLGKDKFTTSDGIFADSWSNLSQPGSTGSKMGWPASGDFMGTKATRPPPPPGLGNYDRTDAFWNHPMNRSTSWAPGEKLKSGIPGQMGGVSSRWLMLKNISPTTDPVLLQKICLKYGPLQNFYYNKATGQVLACYMNSTDVSTAITNISQNIIGSSRPIAELVSAEEIGRLIDSTWMPMPPSSALFGAAMPNAKVNSVRSGWGIDGI